MNKSVIEQFHNFEEKMKQELKDLEARIKAFIHPNAHFRIGDEVKKTRDSLIQYKAESIEANSVSDEESASTLDSMAKEHKVGMGATIHEKARHRELVSSNASPATDAQPEAPKPGEDSSVGAGGTAQGASAPPAPES